MIDINLLYKDFLKRESDQPILPILAEYQKFISPEMSLKRAMAFAIGAAREEAKRIGVAPEHVAMLESYVGILPDSFSPASGMGLPDAVSSASGMSLPDAVSSASPRTKGFRRKPLRKR